METYYKEEIQHISKIPASIKHQMLVGTECYASMHWHKDIELNLMLFGESDFTVDGEKTHLEPGDFIIINSNDLHMGQGRTDIPLSERRQELITILWDYDFLQQYINDGSELRLEMPKDNAIVSQIRDEIVQIGVSNLHKEFAYEMDVTARLLRIGILLLQNCIVANESQKNITLRNKINEIQKAVTYIEGHCDEGLTLNNVAEYVNLVPSYFSRRFKQVTGITFHKYLTSCRIKKSIMDIRNTNLTVNEIAYKNGFPNVKSFIEAFKEIYLVTPQKYRKDFLDGRS